MCNGPYGTVNTAILLDKYIRAYEHACDMISNFGGDINELKYNYETLANTSLTDKELSDLIEELNRGE